MEAHRPDGEIHCRTLWISDIHLGSVDCKAQYLLQLLNRVRCKRLYLVGDIVDIWAMHRRVYWPEAHNAVLRELLRISRSGTELIYIPGNHDQNFREFCGDDFGNVSIRKQHVHRTADGRRLLVTHGDEFDYAVRYSRLTRAIGDWAYDALMTVNRLVNYWRVRTGRPYWSLAGWVKSRVSQAEQAIEAFQHAAIHQARERRLDGIVCGHLHHPVVLQDGPTWYYNDGDWVENCTALVEDSSGHLRLIRAVGSSTAAGELIFAAA